VGVYFLPITLSGVQWLGILFGVLCLGANVPAALLGRQINREEKIAPLVITWASMGAGSLLMLLIGISIQGTGQMSAGDWLIVAWLAVVNTAVTFTIWNHTLRILTAMESSIINNLMMPQIAILAWVFLKESLTVKEITGLILVGAGVLIVQMRRSRAAAGSKLPSERPI
jgi:drug/metabolite transporter (DMT)-like permease